MRNTIFLKSTFVPPKTDQVVDWLLQQNKTTEVRINKISFNDLKNWSFYEDPGIIKHDTGKFFSIEGIRVNTNWNRQGQWEQPIINQPEIGFLGILTREIDGILYFLMQAKIEPGNVNHVQLSPTLQATRSNYTQVHKGKKPLYLEYFQNAKPEQILLDQLQSEQGARFLKKRNRNIIVRINEDIPLADNFIWLTLSQIKNLMKHNNLVNMDTRTVISGITYGSYMFKDLATYDITGDEVDRYSINSPFYISALSQDNTLHSIDEIISFLTDLKSNYDLEISKIPLGKLDGWEFKDNEISHIEGKYFKVIAVDVEIGNREVIRWSQPMIEPAQDGLCAFVCKEINWNLHFAVQAKLECGNHDIIELAPTVQCLTGNYRYTPEGDLPFLDYVLNAKKESIVYDTMQSEEGGRFYREQNRNVIIIAGEEVPVRLPEKYIWMTLNQLYTFLKFNNYLNIQARSLIAAISFYQHKNL